MLAQARPIRRRRHPPMGEFDRKTLYAAVRATKPNIVVETGTAAGASSTFVLAALEKNGRGYMHSIDHSDTSENVGILIPEELRSRNKLHSGDSLALLPSLLPEIGPIDFFIHDSHHSYDHMMAEYELALQHLRTGRRDRFTRRAVLQRLGALCEETPNQSRSSCQEFWLVRRRSANLPIAESKR